MNNIDFDYLQIETYNINQSNPENMSIQMIQQILQQKPRIYQIICKGLKEQNKKFFGDQQENPTAINLSEEQEDNLASNRDLVCPISQCVMEKPMITKCGHSFDSESLDDWLKNGRNDCPSCKKAFSKADLVPDYFIRSLINKILAQNN